jgi:hypothetical protein
MEIGLSFLRVADDSPEGAGDDTHNTVYGRQRPLSFSGPIGKSPDFELSLACGLSGGTTSTANEDIAPFGIFCKKSGVFC